MKLFVCFDDQLKLKDGRQILLSDINANNVERQMSVIDKYDSIYFYGAEQFFQKIALHELSEDFINLVSKPYDEDRPTNLTNKYTLIIDASFSILGVVNKDHDPYRINGEEINVIEISSDVTNENFEKLVGVSISEFDFLYVQ